MQSRPTTHVTGGAIRPTPPRRWSPAAWVEEEEHVAVGQEPGGGHFQAEQTAESEDRDGEGHEPRQRGSDAVGHESEQHAAAGRQQAPDPEQHRGRVDREPALGQVQGVLGGGQVAEDRRHGEDDHRSTERPRGDHRAHGGSRGVGWASPGPPAGCSLDGITAHARESGRPPRPRRRQSRAPAESVMPTGKVRQPVAGHRPRERDPHGAPRAGRKRRRGARPASPSRSAPRRSRAHPDGEREQVRGRAMVPMPNPSVAARRPSLTTRGFHRATAHPATGPSTAPPIQMSVMVEAVASREPPNSSSSGGKNGKRLVIRSRTRAR